MLLLDAGRSCPASCPLLADACWCRSALEARESLQVGGAEGGRALERGAAGYLDDPAAAYRNSVADMCDEFWECDRFAGGTEGFLFGPRIE